MLVVESAGSEARMICSLYLEYYMLASTGSGDGPG
jgi:hypothetical protein